MADDGAIFQNTVPMPRSKAQKTASADAAKPKRQYRKRSELVPVENITSEQTAVNICATLEQRFSSFGIEYIQALTHLLELLQESSRERLVEFIIDAKIV